MTFDEIHQRVGKVPFISRSNAQYLYDLIVQKRLTRILELGIAHGTATCIMAAALKEIGGGRVTAVDLLGAKGHFNPSPEQQLQETGLSDLADVHRMHTGYNWFLHNQIVSQTKNGTCEPIYDLCIIDGPKNWTIDGAAFFMADKLVKPGGYIIFDDYYWTYDFANRSRGSTDGIEHDSLADDERRTPHVKEIFEYLVMQHPDYGEFTILEDTDWAIARKVRSSSVTVDRIYRDSTKDFLARILSGLLRKYRGV